MKPQTLSTFGKELNFELPIPTEILIDYVPQSKKPIGTHRVFITLEPDIVTGVAKYVSILYNEWELDTVLTFDETLLFACPIAQLFEFGTSWLHPAEDIKKKFCVSTICGKKGQTRNRLWREELYKRKDEITIPNDFYVSGNENMKDGKVLGDSKLPLFDSMFHICFENVSQKYYFSEKLIDALITKTVPIYIGCTNIHDYFNMNGIIVAENVDHAISICNNLTEQDYYDRLAAIDENFEKSKYWQDWDFRLEAKLKEII